MLFVPSPSPFRPHLPSWRQPLYLHYRPLWRALSRRLSALEGRVLDVGCGVQPYRPMLRSEKVTYVGLDLEISSSVDSVVGNAESLPFESASFDAVISTQMLEHVRDPLRAMREI